MAELSESQLAFLNSHNVPLSLVFDASGMRTADYKRVMGEEGKCFAIGVTPCARGGHRLRTRAGHCAQCDPAKIAYMLRHVSPGYVYIAGSVVGQLLKVGATESIGGRRVSIRGYADLFDWQILAHAHCAGAGKIEGHIQTRLARFHVHRDYRKGPRRQTCYELFRCNFSRALDVLRSATGAEPEIAGHPIELRSYEFEDR